MRLSFESPRLQLGWGTNRSIFVCVDVIGRSCRRLDGTITSRKEKCEALQLFSSQLGSSAAHLLRLQPVYEAFLATVILAGGLVLAWSVIDLAVRPIAPQWLMLVALTAVSGWATSCISYSTTISSRSGAITSPRYG